MKTFSAYSWSLLLVLLMVKLSILGPVNGDSPPGPVYVNPDLVHEKPELVAATQIAASSASESQITQTVYGFLDFTTTIGNTVMVFMPQSASVTPGTTVEEPSTTEATATTIEEKPITKEQIETEPIGISPSKPVTLPVESQNEEITTTTSSEPMTTTKETTTAEPTTTTTTTTTTKEPPTTKNAVKKSDHEKKSTGAPVTTKKSTAKPTTPTPPKSKPAENANKEPVISSKVVVLAGSKVVENIVTKVEVIGADAPAPSKVEEKAIYSKVEVISGEPVAEVAVNHLQPTPEYDFLSRQPSEVVDETFKVIDLKPSVSRLVAGGQKNRGPDGKLRAFNSVASFNAEEELTTNKAPKKVAVKISPSASGIRILKTAAPKPAARSPNVEPTPAATGLEDESLESLVGAQPGSVLVRQSRRPAIGGGFSKNKYTPTQKSKPSREPEDYLTTEDEFNDFTSSQNEPTTPSYRKGSKFSSKGTTTTTPRVAGFKQNRFNRPTTAEPEVESTEGSIAPRRFQPSAKRYDSNNSGATSAAVVTPANSASNRRTFKKHFQAQEQSQQSSSQPAVSSAPLTFKSKLIRPTGRWEYKTSPKPRVTIRRIDENRHGLQENATTPMTPHFPDVQVDSGDQALAGSGLLPALQHDDDNDVLVQDVNPTATAETIRVEISTPAEFKDIYYEIATIKSPYSFQVGSVKNTRFITVTSTIQKSLVEQTESPVPARVEPLSENILASQAPNPYGRGEQPNDSSTVATLPPIMLSSDQATPPLETMTESFSTTELMLKTHILPVVRGSDTTTTMTLIQSYRVTRLVTAVKTLPPMEAYQFVPSKTLNEFNTRLDEAGSELHLELEYGDNGNDEESHPNAAKAFLDSLDLANVGSNFDLSQMDKTTGGNGGLRSKKAHRLNHNNNNTSEYNLLSQQIPTMSPEQLQQLALYRLLNPNAPFPTAPVITTSRPVLRYETVYETHALPVVNGGSTYYTTLSRPVGTVTRTDYEMFTTTLAVPTQQLQPSLFPQQPSLFPQQPSLFPQQPSLFPQQPSLQFPPMQPSLFPQQPSYAITSTPVVTQSMVTQTDSKVLKLTFGAKTAYTTIYSSSVVPTQVTSYITQSVAVQPTVQAQFPNFIPYGGYPFLG